MTFSPIATPRLLIRSITADDVEDLVLRRSDPSTAEYQGWEVPYTIEKAQALVDGCLAIGGPTPGAWYQMIVVEQESGRIAGDLVAHLSENAKTAEIGYTFHTWARGKGYATEAASALCEYLVRTLGVHRLEATTYPDNAASIRVLQRLGFLAEGVRRESYWVGDAVTDDALFGLLAREWKPIG